jgi:hypothetical protein
MDVSCTKGSSDSCRAIQVKMLPLKQRKLILLATATIHSESLFANGLFQNVFILYKMLESMGYCPMLLVSEKPKDINKVPLILRSVRMIGSEDFVSCLMPVFMIIEVAMSMSCNFRKQLRSLGSRVIKLYLGNILNIDIETPIFYPSMHFAHHITNEIDEIWVSPHYKQHCEYAGLINNLPSAKIAPYIWDPVILTNGGTRSFKWRPTCQGEPQVIVILEPNISFQKCFLIPLLIVEHLYRTSRQDVKVVLGNSDKFQGNLYFMKTILPTLELHKDKKLILSGRNTITSIMTDYPSAFAIGHHWNNEYNYMTLEYLLAGFPIIHNASDWSDAGYYYPESDITKGALVLKNALEFHETYLEKYQAGAAALQWRHSPYNPEVQKAWSKLIEA